LYLYLKFCVAVWVLASGAVQGLSESKDVKELTRLETVWNEAHLRGDAEALDRLLADDVIVTVPNMRLINKADATGIFRSGHMKFHRYETSEIRIRIYGDAAVVTGRLLRTRKLNDQNVEDKWRFTKTYIRRDVKWQVVAWHASTTAP